MYLIQINLIKFVICKILNLINFIQQIYILRLRKYILKYT